MKILMVNKFLYPRGGAETYMLQIGEYLSSLGHEVEYFGMHDQRNVVGNSLGLGTTNMDFHSSRFQQFGYPFRILYSFEAKKKIRHIIQAFSPDIVHLNNVYYHLSPSVIDAADELGVLIVETVHDFYLQCPNHLLLDMTNMTLCTLCVDGSLWNCVKRRCIHDSFPKSLVGSAEGRLHQIKRTYDKVSRFICPSRFMEQMLQKNLQFRGKTVMLQNFVYTKACNPVEKGDYVLYFGRLSEEKGFDRFLDACRLTPEIPYIVAGSGPLQSFLERMSPPNVQYIGFQRGDTLRTLVQRARVVYLPVCYENCPFSVLESQSLGHQYWRTASVVFLN